MPDKQKLAAECEAFPAATCSTSFEMEGLHGVRGQRWSMISRWDTEEDALEAERDYRAWKSENHATGWKDFRVVKVTIERTLVSSNASAQGM